MYHSLVLERSLYNSVILLWYNVATRSLAYHDTNIMFIFKVENVGSARLSILGLEGFVIETKGLAINIFCRYEAGLFFMPCAYTN